MTQTSNGSITITDLTDITDVYLQYCMAVDSITTAAAITAKTTWTPPERGWSTEYPTWQSGYQIWIREVTKKEGIAQLKYGTPYLDKAVNQINNNISNIQTKIKKIWSDSTGSYMASGISGNDVTESNVNTYGFNSKSTTTGISFNYNAIPLTTLGTDGLKLYSPVLTNSIITGNRLDATLTSEGLKLLRGGIEAGTKNTSDYIYVYSHDDATNHTLAINNSGNKSDWRIIAGKNFGVDKAGNLYANEAHINGEITATSLTIESKAPVSGLSTSNIDGMNNYALQKSLDSEITQRKAIYAVSTTEATIAEKTTELGTPSGFVLYKGTTVTVKFDNGNSTTTPTLNVNGTGAKTIKSYTGAALTEAEYTWPAGVTVTFTYDGSYWRMQDSGALQAKADADAAKNLAEKTDQHFWVNDEGVHITKTPRNGTVAGGNTLITNEGMEVRDGNTTLASFKKNGAQIGKGSNAESVFLVDNDGIDLMRKGDNDYVYFHVGYSDNAIGKDGNVLPAPYYTVGNRQEKEDIGAYSYAEGQDVTSSGQASHAEGSTTKASAYCAHAEGGSSQATFSYAHAEGSGTKAMGEAAHAEGSGTKAMGGHSHTEGESTLASEAASAAHAEGELTKATDFCAHAEGYDTVAGGYVSHSEGSGTVASGSCSHAEGIGTVAKGPASHAQNYSTIAEFEYQTVLGKYNANAEGNVVEVGNGGDKNSRSNAVTIDWDGNVTAKGNITAGGSITMNGTNISSIFSGSIYVGFVDKSLSIAASGNTGEGTIDLSKSGYSARCICGWNMSGTGASNCVIPKLYVNNPEQKIHYYIKNTGSSKATPTIRIYILYTKNN